MKENQTIVMQQQILTEKKNLDQMQKKGILYLIILYRVVSNGGGVLEDILEDTFWSPWP